MQTEPQSRHSHVLPELRFSLNLLYVGRFLLGMNATEFGRGRCAGRTRRTYRNNNRRVGSHRAAARSRFARGRSATHPTISGCYLGINHVSLRLNTFYTLPQTVRRGSFPFFRMPVSSSPAWAALFDMDGVVVDNADFHINAWLQFAHQHGFDLTKEQYLEHINGHISADAMAYVFKRPISPGELTVLTEEKESIYRELYHPHLRTTPGLLTFLDELKAQRIPMAVGTSAPESNVRFTLDGLDLRPYFNAIVDASMIQHGKPDPEIYLTAAHRLGVAPAQCVVFEDALAGIEAGLRGGMTVVALATTHTRDELTNSGAALIINDFEGLSPADVYALVPRS